MYKKKVIIGADTTPTITCQLYKVLKVPSTTYFVIRIK